jgi:adenylate cyclase
MPKLVAAVRVAIEKTAPTDAMAASSAPKISSPLGKDWSRHRTAIVMGAIAALAIAAFVAYRSWQPGHRAAGPPEPTAPLRTPAPAPLLPAIPDKSVAVLPFLNMSGDSKQDYFSDGMSEELIDMLTKVPQLRVPARTSSFYFKDKPAAIADIAKALGVMYVVEGSVRKSGKTLRITAQLIRADTGYHLWSETYDRQIDDIFKVQDEIAAAVVKELKISLMAGFEPQSAGTQNVEAYNLYLQAKSMGRHAHGQADWEKVIEYLQKAVKIDPNYANAWALLSVDLTSQWEFGYVPRDQAIEASRRAAQHALQLNANLSDPHTAVARVLIVYDLNVSGAESQVQQALQLDPNNAWALAWAGDIALYKGQFDKAIKLLQRSIANDPVNPIRYDDYSGALLYAGRYAEGLAATRKAIDLDPGRASAIYSESGWVFLVTGDPAAALSELDRDPESRESSAIRVVALDSLGRKAEADAALANLKKNHADRHATGIALIYANRGEFDAAFQWLDRAYRQREASLLNLKIGPFFRNLHSDPRFDFFLRKLNLID